MSLNSKLESNKEEEEEVTVPSALSVGVVDQFHVGRLRPPLSV